MPWAFLDDAFFDHPKVEPLSDRAFRAHIGALCHVARFMTDGVVSKRATARLASSAVYTELVNAGLWDEREDGGINIHGWHDVSVNHKKADIEKRRKQTAERQKRWREAHRENRDNGVADVDANAFGNAARYAESDSV